MEPSVAELKVMLRERTFLLKETFDLLCQLSHQVPDERLSANMTARLRENYEKVSPVVFYKK